MTDPIAFQQLVADVAKDITTIAMTNVGFRNDIAENVAVQTINAVLPRLGTFTKLISSLTPPEPATDPAPEIEHQGV